MDFGSALYELVGLRWKPKSLEVLHSCNVPSPKRPQIHLVNLASRTRSVLTTRRWPRVGADEVVTSPKTKPTSEHLFSRVGFGPSGCQVWTKQWRGTAFVVVLCFLD